MSPTGPWSVSPVVIGLLSATAADSGTSVESFSTVTERGDEIVDLFAVALVISALIFLLVAGLIVAILVRFRAQPGDEEPPQTSGNHALEIAWTAAPVALLAVIFVFTVRTMVRVESDEPAVTGCSPGSRPSITSESASCTSSRHSSGCST